MMKSKKEIPILVNTKTDCCGCGVCSMICPRQAITMIEDEEGFLYPRIDEKLCVRCDACYNACYIKKRRLYVRTNREKL